MAMTEAYAALITTNTRPSIANCVTTGPLPGRANCGRNARKNSAVFGFNSPASHALLMHVDGAGRLADWGDAGEQSYFLRTWTSATSFRRHNTRFSRNFSQTALCSTTRGGEPNVIMSPQLRLVAFVNRGHPQRKEPEMFDWIFLKSSFSPPLSWSGTVLRIRFVPEGAALPAVTVLNSRSAPMNEDFQACSLAIWFQWLRLPKDMTETPPENRRFGHARVSTMGQTMAAQLKQLRRLAAS